MEPVTQRPVPPRADCPDVEDCVADPSEIGRVCVYGPICGTCAVQAPCLEWALSTGQDAGIWGGMTEEERRAARRDRVVGQRLAV